jgi:AcrR family transcriptional regulator
MVIQSASRPGTKPRRPNRLERSEQRRQALFDAAARVVGRLGYAGASIAEITRESQVAQGTFYNYFETRQDLLDQLLPVIGLEMIGFIRAKVGGIGDDIAAEEARFRAFFDFLTNRPEFYRILHEAEQFAPAGHRQHMTNMEHGYMRVLKRARARGSIKDADDFDVEVASYIMMAARDYLSMRYAFAKGEVNKVPEAVIRAYMKFVTRGLFALEAAPDHSQAAPMKANRKRRTP